MLHDCGAWLGTKFAGKTQPRVVVGGLGGQTIRGVCLPFCPRCILCICNFGGAFLFIFLGGCGSVSGRCHDRARFETKFVGSSCCYCLGATWGRPVNISLQKSVAEASWLSPSSRFACRKPARGFPGTLHAWLGCKGSVELHSSFCTFIFSGSTHFGGYAPESETPAPQPWALPPFPV